MVVVGAALLDALPLNPEKDNDSSKIHDLFPPPSACGVGRPQSPSETKCTRVISERLVDALQLAFARSGQNGGQQFCENCSPGGLVCIACLV